MSKNVRQSRFAGRAKKDVAELKLMSQETSKDDAPENDTENNTDFERSPIVFLVREQQHFFVRQCRNRSLLHSRIVLNEPLFVQRIYPRCTLAKEVIQIHRIGTNKTMQRGPPDRSQQ